VGCRAAANAEGFVTKVAVRPLVIDCACNVVVSQTSGLCQILELFAIEHLVTHPTEDRFGEAILPLAGSM
jgi:hypothetical protein